MSTKPLFILIADNGDGSFSPYATFDRSLLDTLRQACREWDFNKEACPGYDADGFHYTTYTVPEDVSIASLGARAVESHWLVQRHLQEQSQTA